MTKFMDAKNVAEARLADSHIQGNKQLQDIAELQATTALEKSYRPMTPLLSYKPKILFQAYRQNCISNTQSLAQK